MITRKLRDNRVTREVLPLWLAELTVAAAHEREPNTASSRDVTISGITIAVTPTISAAAIYASGDAVGGKLEFANAVWSPGGSGVIESVIIIDNDSEEAALDLVLFNQDFTATADNAAFDPTDADLANCIGYIPVTTYGSFNDNSVGVLRSAGLRFTLTAGTTLYGQLVARATPTYTATTDITVKVVIRQD